MKVDGSLRSLLQGVSQQPPRDRLPGQCTEQVNMSSDPVTGLTRRPPTDLVGTLGTASEVLGWHDFSTKDGNKYLAKFTPGNVQVRDLNGVAKTVTVDANAVAYIPSGAKLACGTVDDDTYVANTGKVPALLSTTTAYYNMGTGGKPSGIIQVLGGQYGREYTISFNGTKIAGYSTVDGSDPAHAPLVKTTHIAEVLKWLLLNNGTDTKPAGFPTAGSAGVSYYGTAFFADAGTWLVSRVEDVIRIAKITGTVQFKLSASDDQGNVNLKVMTEQVPDTSDLPRYAPQGYVARVATETDPEEDLWLQFNVEGTGVVMGTGFGNKGFWQETVAPSIKSQFDLATMPHILEYTEATETFRFKRGTWKARMVGTEITNPDPSFVGNPINDISTFQSRLVLLAGSNTIMSRTKKYDDFWIGSASAITDSDPIDISSTAVEASVMTYAVPHNRDLTIHSPNGQFVVFGRSALTPMNAALVLTTAFEADMRARPVPSGRNIFFAHSYGRFTGVREFYTEGGTDINDTRPITQHVKKYLLGGVSKLTSSSNYDTLLVSTDADKKTIYPYQFIWADNEKVQSAWSKWTYPHDVQYTFFDSELIYVVCQVGTEQFLLRQSLDVLDSELIGYPIFLDSRFDVAGVNTQFLLPFDRLHTEALIAVQGSNCPNPGMRAQIQSIDYNAGLPGYVVTLKNDMLGGDIVVGIKFRSSYVPTMPFVKDADGVVIGTGKLRVKQFIATVEDTGDINAYVRSPYGDGPVVSFQGRIVGAVNNIVGEQPLSDDRFYIPFRENTQRADIEIFTESPFPMTMLDIEWVGQYVKSGKRITIGGNG